MTVSFRSLQVNAQARAAFLAVFTGVKAYGIAPGENQGDALENMPYLLGFEKYFAAAVG